MFYLECSDDESVNLTNNVSGFSHENQCEVKQGVTDEQSSTLSNNNTSPGTYFVIHTLTLCYCVSIFKLTRFCTSCSRTRSILLLYFCF